MNRSKLAVAAGLAALLLSGAVAASAGPAWDARHPRRDQVNDRLENQNRRIHNQVKAGDLTHARAARLRANDRGIRAEDRQMARLDGGRITKTDQHVLNAQENANSRRIGN